MNDDVEYQAFRVYGTKSFRFCGDAEFGKRSWTMCPEVQFPDGTIQKFVDGWSDEVDAKIRAAIEDWKMKNSPSSRLQELRDQIEKSLEPIGEDEAARFIERAERRMYERGKKMIDWSKPVRLKGSKKPVRVLATDGPKDWPVCVLVEGGGFMTARADGTTGYTGPCDNDLENTPPEPVVRWVNFWICENSGKPFEEVTSEETEDAARADVEKSHEGYRHVATVRVEFVP